MVGWSGCKELTIEILSRQQATQLLMFVVVFEAEEMKSQQTGVGRGLDERGDQ